MNLLFLGVNNSTRSQMAQGLARHLFGPKHTVYSAGCSPTALHPLALRVLQEIGLDITHQKAQPVGAFDLSEMDLIVALDEKLAIPPVNGSLPVQRWAIPDPSSVTGAEQTQMEAFRDVRDTLETRIAFLLAELG